MRVVGGSGCQTSSSLLARRRLASGTDTLLTAMRRMLNDLRMAYGKGCGQARGQDAVTPPGVGASNRATPTPPVCDPVLWKDIVATGHVPADVLALIKHPWSTSRISPMATNIQLEMLVAIRMFTRDFSPRL